MNQSKISVLSETTPLFSPYNNNEPSARSAIVASGQSTLRQFDSISKNSNEEFIQQSASSQMKKSLPSAQRKSEESFEMIDLSGFTYNRSQKPIKKTKGGSVFSQKKPSNMKEQHEIKEVQQIQDEQQYNELPSIMLHPGQKVSTEYEQEIEQISQIKQGNYLKQNLLESLPKYKKKQANIANQIQQLFLYKESNQPKVKVFKERQLSNLQQKDLNNIPVNEVESQIQQQSTYNIAPVQVNQLYLYDHRVKQQIISTKRQRKRQVERRARQENNRIMAEFLAGKASVMWLFVMTKEIQESQMAIIRDMYKDYKEKDYEMPVCRSYDEAKIFLNLSNCFYKVVADFESTQQLLKQQNNHKNIVAIYIYNPNKFRGLSRMYQMKKITKRVKGMFLTLQQARQKASDDLQNQVKFIRVGEQLQKQREKVRFPSFFILSDMDSTEVTNYRLCLYGSLKLKDKKQRESYLQQFVQVVKMRYQGIGKQLSNLQVYKKIDHLNENNAQKSKQILNFYVKQNFYYALVNSILRVSRSPQQFRPCTIPFNETYHAIKHFYLQAKQHDGVRKKKMVTYRGATLRKNDVQNLKVGSFVELLGFTSTSTQRKQAMKFIRSTDSYLIQIHVQDQAEDQQQEIYDHGYVQVNRFELAKEAFQSQKQVLFNALNVFKVIKMDLHADTPVITMQYGAVLDLSRHKPYQLTPHQKNIIANYQYCTQTFNRIQDDGDVLMIAQQHQKCVQYYKLKVKQDKQSGVQDYKTFGKLANAQLQTGDIDDAFTNALKSLQLLNRAPVGSEEQIQSRLRVTQLNSKVFCMRQDYLHYYSSIGKALKLFRERWFQQAKLLKKQAENRLKIGDYQKCQKDLDLCNQILDKKEASFEQRRKKIERRYFFEKMCCCVCSQAARDKLQNKHQRQLVQLQQDRLQYDQLSDQIMEFRTQTANLQRDLAQTTSNKKLQQKSKQQALSFYASISQQKKQQTNPLLSAKIQVLQATTNERDNLQNYQNKIEAAIEKVKKYDQFHKDIGVYSLALATKRQTFMKKKQSLAPLLTHLQQESNVGVKPSVNAVVHLQASSIQIQPYDHQEDQLLYQKSKQAFEQARKIIVHHHGTQHPDFLSVQNSIAELNYDQNNFQQATSTTSQTSASNLVQFHSEGAKCYAIIAKVFLARGQIKSAFQNINHAHNILKKCLVKVQQKDYNQIFTQHPYYLDIGVYRVKIFNRQLNHDLALRQLKLLKRMVKIKCQNSHSYAPLATVYEQQAQSLICSGSLAHFEQQIMKAVEIRRVEMGQYNIPNAISYSNIFKHLYSLGDLQSAQEYYNKASQIFMRFPTDHPYTWVLYLASALISKAKKEYPTAINQFQECLKVAQKKYQDNCILMMKLYFQYAKILAQAGHTKKAYQRLKQLDVIIETNIQNKKKEGSELAQKWKVQSMNVSSVGSISRGEGSRTVKPIRFIQDQKNDLSMSVLTQIKRIRETMAEDNSEVNLGEYQKYDMRLKMMEHVGDNLQSAPNGTQKNFR